MSAVPLESPPVERSELALLERIALRMDRIERQLDALAPFADLAQQVPNLVATAVDVIDNKICDSQNGGFDLDARIAAAGELVSRLTDPSTMRGIARLLDLLPRVEPLFESGILAPETVEVISKVGQALAQTRSEKSGEAGLFGAWRATRKPEVRRALDFTLRMATHFGASLDEPRRLPSGEVEALGVHAPIGIGQHPTPKAQTPPALPAPRPDHGGRS